MPDRLDPASGRPAHDAALGAAIFAVDPAGLGGVAVRGRAGGARELWFALLRRILPDDTSFRRLPAHVTDDRLIGGLDLAATLSAGRPMIERGILANADGGVLVVPSAERLSPSAAARIVAVMDKGEVAIERDGLAKRQPARFGVVALDEAVSEEERAPAALLDRLAFHIGVEELREDDLQTSFKPDDITGARHRLPTVTLRDEAIEALCLTAAALGIASLNAPLLAARAARCNAALHHRTSLAEEDVAAAARLVLAPRAMIFPEFDEEESEPEQTAEPEPTEPQTNQESDGPLQDVVLAAAQAAIPPDLLARLVARESARRQSGAGGAGASQRSMHRGRPAGTRRGALRSGARLDVLETLRAAAPWQRLRRQGKASPPPETRRRIEVRSDDFRVRQRKDRRETVTLFVVDASGSTALHRLAEAKGAVELFLAECYIRRDQVALLAFGGRGAELLLPPTRSLARAKRHLADLPGGGGTPLAEALDQAALLVQAIKRKHQTPAVVILTDGRPNFARDGRKGREVAEADALEAASALREAGAAAVVIDTSPRADPCAARIAEAIGAHYVPLPYADAHAVSNEVRARIGS